MTEVRILYQCNQKRMKEDTINRNITSYVQEDEIQFLKHHLFSLLLENRMMVIMLSLCSCSDYETKFVTLRILRLSLFQFVQL